MRVSKGENHNEKRNKKQEVYRQRRKGRGEIKRGGLLHHVYDLVVLEEGVGLNMKKKKKRPKGVDWGNKGQAGRRKTGTRRRRGASFSILWSRQMRGKKRGGDSGKRKELKGLGKWIT